MKHRQPLPAAQHFARHISHDEFAATYGANPSDIDRIRQFAREYNLQVLECGDEALRRTVTLASTVRARWEPSDQGLDKGAQKVGHRSRES